jgi:type I restriction enzyme S subunit
MKIAGLPVSTNQGFKSLTAKQDIDNVFLFYQIQRIKNQFIRYGAGSTFLEINKKDTSRIKILHPTNKSVQKKISSILRLIDQAIEKTEALIEKYQNIKAGLMHDLFTRGITADGKLRPPREEAPELYQETPIGWIPMDWKINRIGNVFQIQLGKMLSRASKTGKLTAFYLGNKNVQWDAVDLNDLESMDFSLSEREKFKLCTGDLLVCEGGDVGRTSIWRDELKNCFYQKAIHRLRPKNAEVEPEFMLRYMRYAKRTGVFTNFTSQTSIAHLTQEKLAEVKMFVPSNEEQNRIIKCFNSIDLRINTEIKKLEKLQDQKSGLMHDLLTGEVEVTADEPKVADVL